MKEIMGGVTAPKGFSAAGVHCGVKSRNTDKNDLALIVSERECAAAGVYTRNRVKAAPLYVTMEHLENGTARAIIANSGNANACAPNGSVHARKMAELAAAALSCQPEDIAVASTGVIGQELNIAAIEAGMPALCAALSEEGSDAAATAIMTTDTVKKEYALELSLGGAAVRVGAIAKGSGMIHPNMGTLLCFVTTDCAITPELLSEALRDVTARSFNRVSVDRDTSTNDMCLALANGMAGNALIEWKDEAYHAFAEALEALCVRMARAIAGDGEGATHLLTCRVHGARGEDDAERLSMAVIASPLVKSAMFGADANWGRVLCAMGYSKAPFRPEYVDIRFHSDAGEILVCKDGAGLPFDEALAKKILSAHEIIIDVALREGAAEAVSWGCDLSYEYVRINGDYRT